MQTLRSVMRHETCARQMHLILKAALVCVSVCVHVWCACTCMRSMMPNASNCFKPTHRCLFQGMRQSFTSVQVHGGCIHRWFLGLSWCISFPLSTLYFASWIDRFPTVISRRMHSCTTACSFEYSTVPIAGNVWKTSCPA